MNRILKIVHGIVCFAVICSLTEALLSANLVVVRARASEAYVESQKKEDDEKVEKYHIVKGRFYPGDRIGNWAETMPVDQIVADVSSHLKRKGFQVENEDEQSKYAIVLHYGISSGLDSFVVMTGQTKYDVNLVATPSLTPFSSKQELGKARNVDLREMHRRIYSKIGDEKEYSLIELLGMDRLRYISRNSSERQLIENLMLDERYFMILMAYGIEEMESDEEKEPLWSTHYNIQARGQTYEQAVKDMNLVASDYFGAEHEKLIKVLMTKKVRKRLLDQAN